MLDPQIQASQQLLQEASKYYATEGKRDPEIEESLERRVEKIRDEAFDLIRQSLDLIDTAPSDEKEAAVMKKLAPIEKIVQSIENLQSYSKKYRYTLRSYLLCAI